MKISVGLKIAGCFALVLSTLLILGVVSFQTTTQLYDSNGMVKHTFEVLLKLDRILTLMQDCETGQRGYILTGERRYLEPYDAAVGHVPNEINSLKDKTKDNTSQQGRIQALAQGVQAKLSFTKETIELRTTKGFEPAQKLILTDRGKQAMDDIRKVLDEMKNEELRLLKNRTDAAEANAENMKNTIRFGIPLVVVLASLAGFLLTRNITQPLARLTQAAEKIAVGEITTNFRREVRGDEIGELNESFHRMARSLVETAGVAQQISTGNLAVRFTPQSERDLLGNALAEMIASFRLSTQQLQEGASLLAAATSQIMTSVAQVAASTTETAAAITETAATTEEVKQTANLSSQKARYVAETAQKSAQVTQTGQLSVNETLNEMHLIQEQVRFIADGVIKLSEQSQTIGEIITTVNDIAEQSNILAINASIEAAHAGEHGKGFAVVAQEVRSLADQSKQATAQVRSILSDVQKAVNSAVLSAEKGNKAVQEGVRQATEAGASIHLLSQNIQEAANAATQISFSAQEQLVGVEQVMVAVESIRLASQQNVQSMTEVKNAAQNLNVLGSQLRQLAEKFKL